MLAYSSIEHSGLLALGFGFGGLGSFAAILHMIFHSLAKSALFFSAGNVFLKYSSVKIARIRGVLSLLPITGPIFLLGFLAIVGVPPFGIFITETYILSAGISKHPFITLTVLLLLALVFIGFLKHMVHMIFGKIPESIQKGEASYWTTIPSIILILLLIITGFYLPKPLESLINSAAALLR